MTKLDMRWHTVDGHHVGEIFTTGFTRCACKCRVREGDWSEKLRKGYMVLQYTWYCSMHMDGIDACMLIMHVWLCAVHVCLVHACVAVC
jgi:hypothetical protein